MDEIKDLANSKEQLICILPKEAPGGAVLVWADSVVPPWYDVGLRISYWIGSQASISLQRLIKKRTSITEQFMYPAG